MVVSMFLIQKLASTTTSLLLCTFHSILESFTSFLTHHLLYQAVPQPSVLKSNGSGWNMYACMCVWSCHPSL